METERYLDPISASDFLQQRYNMRCKPGTLSKWRCLGGGPTFVLIGRFPRYTEQWLEEFALSRMSGPKGSTSAAA
jgi:hypothetical protein